MKVLIQFFALLLAFSLYSFSVPEKTNDDDRNLLIHFTMEDDMVYMHCKKGCSWDKLEFEASDGKTYSVDQDGIQESSNTLIRITPGRGNFVFTVKKGDKGLEFASQYGLKWRSLTANCKKVIGNCLIKVDENGVQVK